MAWVDLGLGVDSTPMLVATLLESNHLGGPGCFQTSFGPSASFGLDYPTFVEIVDYFESFTEAWDLIEPAV